MEAAKRDVLHERQAKSQRREELKEIINEILQYVNDLVDVIHVTKFVNPQNLFKYLTSSFSISISVLFNNNLLHKNLEYNSRDDIISKDVLDPLLDDLNTPLAISNLQKISHG